jgi:hypothetical protein
MATVNAQGVVQVLNTALVQLNGSTFLDIQGYMTSIRWSTNTQTEHVSTINPNAESLTVGLVNSKPSGSITFVAGMFPTFYQFLNNRSVPFDLQLISYTTGNLGGATQSVLLTGVLLDVISGSIEQSNPANQNTFDFKFVSAKFL